jgi:hypothetical protein
LLLHFYAQPLQAIIRGLKESGVFTNAVTSAKAQSKTKSSNMGLGNKDPIQPNGTAGQSTLEGSHGKLQATVRKILEMVDTQEEAAMPPMSPPGFLELTEIATAFSWRFGLTMRDACSLEHTNSIGLFGRRRLILQPQNDQMYRADVKLLVITMQRALNQLQKVL